MNLISRYIIRSHIAPFIFGFATVVFLFLMQFVMQNLDELVGKGLDTYVILQLITLNLAWMVVLAVPMGVLFSTLMSFGAMSAAHEITIIKASGGGLLKMMRPVVLISTLLTLGLFYFNDIVLPESNYQAKILLSDIKRLKPTFAIESGRFAKEIDGYTILARQMDSTSGAMKGVTIYNNTISNQSSIISADSGTVGFSQDYSKLLVQMYDGEIHQSFDLNVKNYKKILFKRYQISMDASGFAFSRSDDDMMSRGQREMRIKDMQEIVDEAYRNAKNVTVKIDNEIINHFARMSNPKIRKADTLLNNSSFDPSSLSAQINVLNKVNNRITFLQSKIRSEIYVENDAKVRAREFEVEIWKKYSIPFACFIFALVGVPLGIITKGGNFGISAAISLGFYILYWASLIGGEKLADRGILSPFLGMWLGNFIIGGLGILLILKVNYEITILPSRQELLKFFRLGK